MPVPFIFKLLLRGVSQGGLRYWRAGLGDELRDDHSNDGGDETDKEETDGNTSHEGRYD